MARGTPFAYIDVRLHPDSKPFVATRKTSSRSSAERARVTNEWLRACEELHRALITPAGLPPRQWAAKVALAAQVDGLHLEMLRAWGLPEAPGAAAAPIPGA